MANEKRLRIRRLEATTTNDPLASGGTSITVTHDAALEAIDADNHLALVLDPEEANGAHEVVYGTAYSEAGGVGTITVTRGEEGTTARQHAQGTVLRHGPTLRDHAVGRMDTKRRTSSVDVSGTTYATVDANLDCSVNASPGDLVTAHAGFQPSGGGTGTEIWLDFVSIDGAGDPVNSWAADGAPTGTDRITSMIVSSGANWGFHGVSTRRIVAGDIVDGVLTVRLRARLAASGTRTILGFADRPIQVMVINHGPQES